MKEDDSGRLVFHTIEYRRGGIEIIDQTLLPEEEKILRIEKLYDLLEAIINLRVRGAPAIGIAAAYGMLLAAERAIRECAENETSYLFDWNEDICVPECTGISYEEFRLELDGAREKIAATRPTAVNLFWALERMKEVYEKKGDPGAVAAEMARTAFAIHADELDVEFAIGDNGSVLIEDGMNVLTHCNAGGLATAGYGTALGVIFSAYEKGKRFHVYVDETRPLLQGARLTAWELSKRGIPHTVICDDFAATLFASGRVDAVIVGADRIAANGDTANKVGTLGLAILCDRFDKAFYVAAPLSTFDPSLKSGVLIPIEERDADEVALIGGKRFVPEGSRVFNPAFDVTPHELITGIITEKGIVEHPNREKVLKLFDL